MKTTKNDKQMYLNKCSNSVMKTQLCYGKEWHCEIMTTMMFLIPI